MFSDLPPDPSPDRDAPDDGVPDDDVLVKRKLDKKALFEIIAATALGTAFLFLLGLNLAGTDAPLQAKVEHQYAITDPQFQREMSVLLGPTIVPGNRVQDLQNGDEIFPAMLAAIRAAEKTITFETYIYWSGEIGDAFAEALQERARAGVRVHVLVDWAGAMKLDGAVLDALEESGADVEQYRPLTWYSLDRVNNRTHRKLLVVDGTVGFTGGVGIADPWLGDAEDADHWRDMHFQIEGPVVAQIQAAFLDNWVKATGTSLSGPDYFPDLQPVGDVPAQMFTSSPSGGSSSMHLMYLMTLAAAEKTIDIAAAYFVPDDLVLGALRAAGQRGVRIRILVPGEHLDSELVRLSSKSVWGELIQAGAEFYVFDPTMHHSKALIVDGEMVSVGSTNFDRRSFELNDEASLNLYSFAFARHMTEIYEADLKRARPYTYAEWQNRPWTEKLAEKVLIPIKSQL